MRSLFFVFFSQKVEQSAEKKGIPPQQFVDEVSAEFRQLLELLNISNDKFIRTTEEDHKKAVQVSQWPRRLSNGVHVNDKRLIVPLAVNLRVETSFICSTSGMY